MKKEALADIRNRALKAVHDAVSGRITNATFQRIIAQLRDELHDERANHDRGVQDRPRRARSPQSPRPARRGTK